MMEIGKKKYGTYRRRVLLVKPPSDLGSKKRGMSLLPPLGLSYIGAILQARGFDVSAIDGDVDSQLKSDSQVQLVGIGPCLGTNFWSMIDIAERCKAVYPQAAIAIGGPHLTNLPKTIAEELLDRFPFVNFVCQGDGEEAILEVVATFCGGPMAKTASDVDIHTCSSRAMRQVVEGKWHDSIDGIPFPIRELFEHYKGAYGTSVRRCAHKDIDGLRPHIIISSRGCPFRCVFCCSKKPRQVRSPDNVVEEMVLCSNKFGAKFFAFFDDMFCDGSKEDIERVLVMCAELSRRMPNTLWEVELRADVICKMGIGVLKAMYNSGCRIINIGFEKGYQQGLDNLMKDMNLEDAYKSVKIVRAAGDYSINGTFIVGGKDETREDALDTVGLAIKLDLDYAVFAPLTVHFGTKLYYDAVEEGCIQGYWKSYARGMKYPLYTGKHLDEAMALSIVREGYKRFYFRKEYFEKRISQAKDCNGRIDLIAEYNYWLKRAKEEIYYIDQPVVRHTKK